MSVVQSLKSNCSIFSLPTYDACSYTNLSRHHAVTVLLYIDRLHVVSKTLKKEEKESSYRPRPDILKANKNATFNK